MLASHRPPQLLPTNIEEYVIRVGQLLLYLNTHACP
jgi:hypothetical protein